jgi:predicted nucleic acid-binding protein
MNGTLVDRVRGKRRVHLDSMVVVYFVQQNPSYVPIIRPMFQLIGTQQLVGISSYVTLLEVLVHPFSLGHIGLAGRYRQLLARALDLFPVDRAVAERGAEIRAKYKFRTPDAIQLATSLEHGADVFITNDLELKRFDELQVLILDDFLSPAGG